MAYINPARGSISDPFYGSPAWKAFRAAVIRERGLRCQDKEHPPGQPVMTVDLDHIVELRDGGARLDRRNVMLRCRSCHVRKTQQARKDRLEREYWARQSRLTGGS
jgi:5-methylcytosine-specific restriction protein A